MRKIPTLFVRDPDNRRYLLPEVTPGCEWVLRGEGVPTRKFDGVCLLVRRGGAVFARREVKPGGEWPASFEPVQYDDATGKTYGWEPATQSGFSKYISEALRPYTDIEPGTYELIGPKINGNPEQWPIHVVAPHGCEQLYLGDPPFTYEKLSRMLPQFSYEGVVWHHPDGRMAKLKKRDFPPTSPTH